MRGIRRRIAGLPLRAGPLPRRFEKKFVSGAEQGIPEFDGQDEALGFESAQFGGDGFCGAFHLRHSWSADKVGPETEAAGEITARTVASTVLSACTREPQREFHVGGQGTRREWLVTGEPSGQWGAGLRPTIYRPVLFVEEARVELPTVHGWKGATQLPNRNAFGPTASESVAGGKCGKLSVLTG